ncbi:hypothetical protein [Variovorax saccharolyticus]|uniref:hypothetical protein n=1 Tax=Variovorax saccharolyticus TaxID=3053516 RepID=UPI002577B79E|nr:hypothetical protein [Variovorax sp. J31P216]MDM0029881.1 hypothetical protein [Variovorax sp. J31P216]
MDLLSAWPELGGLSDNKSGQELLRARGREIQVGPIGPSGPRSMFIERRPKCDNDAAPEPGFSNGQVENALSSDPKPRPLCRLTEKLDSSAQLYPITSTTQYTEVAKRDLSTVPADSTLSDYFDHSPLGRSKRTYEKAESSLSSGFTISDRSETRSLDISEVENLRPSQIAINSDDAAQSAFFQRLLDLFESPPNVKGRNTTEKIKNLLPIAEQNAEMEGIGAMQALQRVLMARGIQLKQAEPTAEYFDIVHMQYKAEVIHLYPQSRPGQNLAAGDYFAERVERAKAEGGEALARMERIVSDHQALMGEMHSIEPWHENDAQMSGLRSALQG